MVDVTDSLGTDATGPASAGPVADQFVETLMQVLPRLSRVYKAQLRGAPLSPPQMFMLMELQNIVERQPDGAQPGELARQCGLSAPGVTAALDDLVAGGYCVRSHGEQDRRKVFVRPTEHGLRTLEAVRGGASDGIREMLNDTIQGWNDAHMQALTAMLRDLGDAAETYLDRLRS